MKRLLLSILLVNIYIFATAQTERWQQRVEYKMDVDFDHQKHQYKGKQKIKYYNNSPDTLKKVFYHLYFNAFQPNSMMDVRSRTIEDPSRKIGDRIFYLEPEDQGFIQVKSLKQKGKKLHHITEGTILEVTLNKPILPGKNTEFEMEYLAQVPLQIRRSGRNNAEGIDYSMAQWYPKMCEYDYQGWHANPYIAREFHGVWGDFEVNIKIDAAYIIGATGELQNNNKIGHGYEDESKSVTPKKSGKQTWKFKAKNVHDFVWAADPDYVVKKRKTKENVALYFVYQPDERTTDNWTKLPDAMVAALPFMNEKYGEYPYPVYSFIQGGDGGMEYPMATLITGYRSYTGLVSVSIHEWMHSWYQMVLATNEALYYWMDEGFTNFGQTATMNYLREVGQLNDRPSTDLPYKDMIFGYTQFAQSGKAEPLTSHADHFNTNVAYGVGAYTKGAIFLKQLEYIMGKSSFDKGLKRYYNTWKFKHPNPNDCIRVMEKESGLELDWYKEYWVNTTYNIDYEVSNVIQEKPAKAIVLLKKNEIMPMPVDLEVTYTDGSTDIVNIPLRMMRGHKMQKDIKVMEDWPWTNDTYLLKLDTGGRYIAKVHLDATFSTADIDRDNNVWEK